MTRRLDQALASARLCTELGLRLVPGQPTASQCRVGAKAADVSLETARLVYLAMLEADEISGGAP